MENLKVFGKEFRCTKFIVVERVTYVCGTGYRSQFQRGPNRISETTLRDPNLGSLGKDRWFNGQVGTRWSTWDRWDRDRGFSILGRTGWDWDRGVFRLGGTGWDNGQVSV